MRHDVASRSLHETSYAFFEKDLPLLIHACREIADYAKQYSVITSVENHGFYIQASERVLRLVRAVDRDNFKTTLDVGNFLCVDEDPIVGVANNLPYASMFILKTSIIERQTNCQLKKDGYKQPQVDTCEVPLLDKVTFRFVKLLRICKKTTMKVTSLLNLKAWKRAVKEQSWGWIQLSIYGKRA